MMTEDPGGISERLTLVNARIDQALRDCGRPPGSVALIAVSKRHPAAAIRAAIAAGQHRFGENYLQEALEKIDAINSPGIEWHFIGPLQSNKSRAVAEHFDWLHTLDRLKLAQRLSAQRPAQLDPLQLCIQVNIDGEESKSGVPPDQLLPLALEVAALPRIRLRGLMAIPAPVTGSGSAAQSARRAPHDRLAALLDQLNRHGLELDTLSIGMSDDLEQAVAAGATMVRIGTAIFGARG